MKVLSKEILGYERDESVNKDVVLCRGGEKASLANMKKKSTKIIDDENLMTYPELFFNDMDLATDFIKVRYH